MLRYVHLWGSGAVGVLIDVEGMTAEQYQLVAARLGWTGSDVTPPPGLVLHAAGPTRTGFRIVDVWSDEASFRQFSTTSVAAAVEGLGLPPYEPEVFPLEHVLR